MTNMKQTTELTGMGVEKKVATGVKIPEELLKKPSIGVLDLEKAR